MACGRHAEEVKKGHLLNNHVHPQQVNHFKGFIGTGQYSASESMGWEEEHTGQPSQSTVSLSSKDEPQECA